MLFRSIDQHNANIEKQIAELTQTETGLRQQHRQRTLETRRQSIPEVIRSDVLQALEQKPEQLSEIQKYLAEKFMAFLNVSDADVEATLTEAEKAQLKSLADQRAALPSQKKSYGVIQALWDVGAPPVSHVHRRGNAKAHGVLVQPGFPEILQPAAN